LPSSESWQDIANFQNLAMATLELVASVLGPKKLAVSCQLSQLGNILPSFESWQDIAKFFRGASLTLTKAFPSISKLL